MSQTTDTQNPPSYADERPANAGLADNSCPLNAACAGRPEACPTCNPTEALYECGDCGRAVTDNTWTHHIPTCPNREPNDPDPPAKYPIPAPRIAQLTIELLDVIRVRPPHDTPHVTRAADHTDIPITNTGVLRLLRKPLDQKTTTALTAELARYGADYLTWARRIPAVLETERAMARSYGLPHEPQEYDWDADDRTMRAHEQTRLRNLINAAVNR